MNEKQILQEFGLNNRETEIYLNLLNEKICNASKLAKLCNINRTTTYLELERLIRKGLVNYIIKNSKRYYRANSPNQLLKILEIKKEQIKSILPNLKQRHHSIELFKIEVFEGKKGIQNFYQNVLDEGKEILAFGVTGKAFETMEFVFPHFVKKYIKKKIRARYLANYDAKKLLQNLPKNFVEIKYLPEQYKSEITTIIYSGKIVLQSLIKENMFVVLIKDKKLYEGYKAYFEFMWNSV